MESNKIDYIDSSSFAAPSPDFTWGRRYPPLYPTPA
jgi:hypothetical protein